MIVVSDTTPLISLLKIGRLDLLRTLFGEVHVPTAVFEELTQNPRFKDEAEQVRSCPFLKVGTADEWRVRHIIEDTGLDLGESEAIVLAESLDASLTLIDESRARAVAKQRGLRITGTVGILDRAFRLNHITAEEICRYAASLRANGRYISGELLDGLLAQTR